MRGGMCRTAVAAAMVMFTTLAVAQIIPPSAQPGRERERFTVPEAPLSQPGGTKISLPSTVAPEGAERTFLVVRSVRVTGATVYTQAQLAPLYADLVGKRVSLKAIYDLAQKITSKYGNDGYVISRAIVPPQQLEPSGADVVIQVVEGYVDKVEWPEMLSRYRDFFTYYTQKITAERPANIRTIERYLLLAGDLPGLKFKNSLKPSTTNPGAATLVVEVVLKPVDLLARTDNRGTASQGYAEYLATVTINNLLHLHDSVTVTAAGPFKTEELKYFYGQYSQVLNPEGLLFYIDGSTGYGRPGTDPLRALDYRTRSDVYETALTYPLIRSRERNLSVTLLGFAESDTGSILDMPDTPPSTHDDLRGVRAKANADFVDPFSGINQLIFVVSQGVEGLGSTHDGNPLASRLNGRVDFTKFELTGTHVQPLFANLSALVAAYGQYAAGTPLLSPELCGYGGRVFGRAYDPSALVGDTCFEALGELRADVPLPSWMSKDVTQFQLYGFADHGWLHNLAPDVGTPTNMVAASAGGGLRLGLWNTWAADLSADKGIAGPRNDWRFFFVVAAKY
jgi:hemolysin activation/secretion protein